MDASQTWPLRITSSASIGYTVYPEPCNGYDEVVFQKEAQHAVLGKSSAEFKQWCRNSLAKGAAGGSCFLKEGRRASPDPRHGQ